MKFRFEIQNCIQVCIEACDADEARDRLLCSLDDYAGEMVGPSCYVSDGEEVPQ
jgi:hypothetical protein